MELRIRAAGLSIRLRGSSDALGELCRGYVTEEDGEPDICADISPAMLEPLADRMLAQEGYVPSLRELETMAALELVAEAALERDILLMHGAAVAVADEAYLFIAPSGTGKSTHVKLWLDALPDAYVVNGDKPLLRIGDGETLVCGTPWCGKEHWSTNTMAPLRAIVIMERAEENRMEPLRPADAFPDLLRQSYRGSNGDALRKTLALLKKLGSGVAFYRFRFDNFREDAFSVAYAALHEHNTPKTED